MAGLCEGAVGVPRPVQQAFLGGGLLGGCTGGMWGRMFAAVGP